jgi:putative oxidoreductase
MRCFHKLEFYGWPLLQLFIRWHIATVFWHSGRAKFHHWDSTLNLFKVEYKVPYISSDLAAYLTTAFELICPILLVLGLMTRFATLPLLVITAVIQATYISHPDHLYWALLLGILLLKGAGALSLDALWCRRHYSKFSGS